MRPTIHLQRLILSIGGLLLIVFVVGAVIAQQPRDAQRDRERVAPRDRDRPILRVRARDRDVKHAERRDVAEWTERSSMPDQRTELAATTCGRYIYVAGGFGPPDTGEIDDPLAFEEAAEQTTAPRTVWKYDPRNDAWDELTQLPEGVNHAPFQFHQGRLYVLGGFRENTFDPIATVRIYDIEDDEWTKGAEMPTPRGASAWTVLRGRIHVIGGNTTGTDAITEEDYERGVLITHDDTVNTHEAYDPATDSWEKLAPMPTPRNHTGAAALDGKIHVVLGRVDQAYFTMKTHEIYDPLTNTWSRGPDAPTGRSGVAVLEHHGYIYAFGGERLDDPYEQTFDSAERFNPYTNQWEILPSMPTARHGLAAASFGNAIYVISGGPEPALTFSNVNERIEIARESMEDLLEQRREVLGMR